MRNRPEISPVLRRRLAEQVVARRIFGTRYFTPPGPEGILLEDVAAAPWFEGLRFFPERVPAELRIQVWRLACRLGVEVAIQAEYGRVRLISGEPNRVPVDVGAPGVHPVAHTHPSPSAAHPSTGDLVTLTRHVDALREVHPDLAAADLSSMVLYGDGPEDYTLFYGNG